MCSVGDRDDTTTATNRLVSSDVVNFQALDDGGNIIFVDVTGQRNVGLVIAHMLGDTGCYKARHVILVAWDSARFQAGNRHATFRVDACHVVE